MKRLTKDWQGWLLSAVALVIMVSLLRQSRFGTSAFQNQVFENAAKWAIRFLLISLAMSPLNTYFGWRWAVKLRKPAGLWAFGFAVLHFLLYVSDESVNFWAGTLFEKSNYILIGLAALGILAALAATSYQWAMKKLGKNWKRLHRLVYVAGALAAVHAILAFSMSKKSLIISSEPSLLRYELILYAILMTILLVLRIPAVRGLFKNRRRAQPQIVREV
ncbi:MAG: ferric reductase-like transmembrane domain-containing protein [Anaerolineae bacterium]|nr:ferric reductase-like transmembrane domain-containing protein [Anaerolineae bacterium]